MAIVRYLVLAAPCAWLGIRFASALGYAGLYGLLLALVVAAGITSALFLVWIRSALRTVAGAGAPRTGLLATTES